MLRTIPLSALYSTYDYHISRTFEIFIKKCQNFVSIFNFIFNLWLSYFKNICMFNLLMTYVNTFQEHLKISPKNFIIAYNQIWFWNIHHIILMKCQVISYYSNGNSMSTTIKINDETANKEVNTAMLWRLSQKKSFTIVCFIIVTVILNCVCCFLVTGQNYDEVLMSCLVL